MNAFVSRPLLNIQDPATREFFGTLLHKHFRGSMHQKLSFLRRILPAIGSQQSLLKDVEGLASARNRLVHIYPDYLVALGPKLDTESSPDEEDWIEYPNLQWTRQHMADAERAQNGYSTAIAFIDALPIALPPYEATKIAYDNHQSAASNGLPPTTEP